MTGVERIEAKCLQHGVRYERDVDAITVHPANKDGFPVFFMQSAGAYHVSALGWHADVDDLDDALACVAQLLSEDSRLVVSSKGDSPYHWRLETKNDDGHWERFSEVALMIYPFWKRTTKEIFRNSSPFPKMEGLGA